LVENGSFSLTRVFYAPAIGICDAGRVQKIIQQEQQCRNNGPGKSLLKFDNIFCNDPPTEEATTAKLRHRGSLSMDLG